MAGREGASGRRARALRIAHALRDLHPDAGCALRHGSALELLVATILSAQCTDERVNRVTPGLFRAYPDAAAYANADPARLEEAIRPTGFFRSKARALIATGRALVDRHGGEVPDRMEDLARLTGVGRKTANVVLGTWYGRPAIFVDTHVKRLAGRLGLTGHSDPDRIERDLMDLLPEDLWTATAHALIHHGRRVCSARSPRCDACGLRVDCPFPGGKARG